MVRIRATKNFHFGNPPWLRDVNLMDWLGSSSRYTLVRNIKVDCTEFVQSDCDVYGQMSLSSEVVRRHAAILYRPAYQINSRKCNLLCWTACNILPVLPKVQGNGCKLDNFIYYEPTLSNVVQSITK